ncbi:MAG: LysM peptidoglycan-binding domain-containing protein [Rhodospirillales bacterium]
MNRPVIIGLAGGAIVLAAIGMSVLMDGAPEPTASAPPPVVSPAAAPSDAAKPPPSAAAPPRPRFDVVRVTPKGDAVIAGRASPGARITVRDGAAILGTVIADGRGEWVLVPDRPLAPGARELTLSMAGDGILPADADRAVVVVVPPRDGARPDGDAPPMAVAVGRDGLRGPEVMQAPAGGLDALAPAAGGAPAGASRRPSVSLEAVDYDSEGNAVFAGRATPDATVNLYVDNKLVGSAQADDRGAWQLQTNQPLSASEHTVRVDSVGVAGKVTGRAEAPFAPAAMTVSETSIVVVEAGNTLWRIARRQLGRGILYTVIYEANRQQIRDPDLIYPGQIFRVPDASRVN